MSRSYEMIKLKMMIKQYKSRKLDGSVQKIGGKLVIVPTIVNTSK